MTDRISHRHPLERQDDDESVTGFWKHLPGEKKFMGLKV